MHFYIFLHLANTPYASLFCSISCFEILNTSSLTAHPLIIAPVSNGLKRYFLRQNKKRNAENVVFSSISLSGVDGNRTSSCPQKKGYTKRTYALSKTSYPYFTPILNRISAIRLFYKSSAFFDI